MPVALAHAVLLYPELALGTPLAESALATLAAQDHATVHSALAILATLTLPGDHALATTLATLAHALTLGATEDLVLLHADSLAVTPQDTTPSTPASEEDALEAAAMLPPQHAQPLTVLPLDLVIVLALVLATAAAERVIILEAIK